MANADLNSADIETVSLSHAGDSDDDRDSLLSVDRFTETGEQAHDGAAADSTVRQSMKALEAGVDEEQDNEEDARRPTSPTSTSQLPISSQQTPSFEHTPLLDAGPAPPDYSQATAHRTFANRNVHRRRGYNSTALTAEDDSDDLDLAASPKKLRLHVRRNWRQVCLLNLVVSSLLATTILLVTQWISPGAPRIDTAIYADHPDATKSWIERETRFHRNIPGCTFDSYNIVGYPSWRIANFSLAEAIEPPEDPELSDLYISGDIEIRPAPYAQVYPIETIVGFAITEPWEIKKGDVEWIEDELVVRFPRTKKSPATKGKNRRSRSRSTKRACLHVWLGVYVKHNYDTLQISAGNSNINIGYPKSFDPGRNWMVHVLNKVQMSTTGGNISVSYLYAPEVDLRTTDGSIKGNFSLKESVKMSTTTGDIDVTINESANQDPISHVSSLTTSTVTGSQRLSLHHEDWNVEWNPREFWYNTTSYHESYSGNISLNYTGWEGNLSSTTAKGAIQVEGKGFNSCADAEFYDKNADAARSVCIVRGSQASMSTVKSLDGDIKVELQGPTRYWPAMTV